VLRRARGARRGVTRRGGGVCKDGCSAGGAEKYSVLLLGRSIANERSLKSRVDGAVEEAASGETFSRNST